MVMLWITDTFWFVDPEIKDNLCMSHCKLLHIVHYLQGQIKDSLNLLSGTVKVSKEFKVGVGLYYLGHGGTWQSLSNLCCIGLSSAKGSCIRYVKLFASAVVAVLKPAYVPGEQCADCVVHIKCNFSERQPEGIGDAALTVGHDGLPWTPDNSCSSFC